eukprot:gene7976-biopygen18095
MWGGCADHVAFAVLQGPAVKVCYFSTLQRFFRWRRPILWICAIQRENRCYPTVQFNGPCNGLMCNGQRPNVQRSTVIATVTTVSRRRQRHGNMAATACPQLWDHHLEGLSPVRVLEFSHVESGDSTVFHVERGDSTHFHVGSGYCTWEVDIALVSLGQSWSVSVSPGQSRSVLVSL